MIWDSEPLDQGGVSVGYLADDSDGDRERVAGAGPTMPKHEGRSDITHGEGRRIAPSSRRDDRKLRRARVVAQAAVFGTGQALLQEPNGIVRSKDEAAGAGAIVKPRLIMLNVMLLAAGVAAWRSGYLGAFGLLGWHEIALLALLGAYAAVGLGAAWCGRWETVRRVANALPAWGLAFTGIGLLLAAAGLHDLTPAALSSVFRALVFAVAPNIVGVLGFAWLTALANWAAGEDT